MDICISLCAQGILSLENVDMCSYVNNIESFNHETSFIALFCCVSICSFCMHRVFKKSYLCLIFTLYMWVSISLKELYTMIYVFFFFFLQCEVMLVDWWHLGLICFLNFLCYNVKCCQSIDGIYVSFFFEGIYVSFCYFNQKHLLWVIQHISSTKHSYIRKDKDKHWWDNTKSFKDDTISDSPTHKHVRTHAHILTIMQCARARTHSHNYAIYVTIITLQSFVTLSSKKIKKSFVTLRTIINLRVHT